MDKISALPKWVQIVGGIVLVGIFLFIFIWFGFGMDSRSKAQEEEAPKVLLDMPEPEVESDNRSRYQAYAESELLGNSVTDYWNDLGSSSDLVSGDGSSQDVVDPFSSSYSGRQEEYLDPSVYTKEEIFQIRNGFTTKSEVDAMHRFEQSMREQRERDLARGSSSTDGMTQEQRDSAYFARLERSYSIAGKYVSQMSGMGSSGAGEEPASESASAAQAAPEPEPERRLDLNGSKGASLSMSGFDDGIITSLDATDTDDFGSGLSYAKPVKATFLKNEKLASGQRVIIRLMQDLQLSDGTVIPANTHITGECNIGRRLKISIKSIHYNGRLYQANVSAYDNDGMEGIYCVAAEQNQRRKDVEKSGKSGVANVASGVLGAVGGLFGGGIGSMAASSIASSATNAVSQILNSDGSIEVNVSAGYEFYVYDNPDENRG